METIQRNFRVAAPRAGLRLHRHLCGTIRHLKPKINNLGVHNVNVELRQLFTFTEIYVERARELARSGHKDEARCWYRYFDNSGVLSFLESYNGNLPIDLGRL